MTIADSQINASDLRLAGNGYEVAGRGSLDMNGKVAFTGRPRCRRTCRATSSRWPPRALW